MQNLRRCSICKMWWYLLLALVVLPGFEGNIIRGEKGAIVGGKEIDITQAPHMVALLLCSKIICGGSIVNEYTILTAGHCVNGITDENLSVRIGSSFHDKEGIVHDVESFIIHEKYISTEEYLDYDVALIRLKEPMQFSEKAKPILLPETTPETGEAVRIFGWGETKVSTLISQQLRAAEVNIVDWEKCNEAYEILTPRMMCASRAGIDSCQGDSGGGMEYKGAVVGIVSWGYGCAEPDYPGVYANVAHPEILEFIKKNSN